MSTLIQRIALLAILAVYCPSVFAQTNPLDTASICYQHVQDYLDHKIGSTSRSQAQNINYCLKIAQLDTIPLITPVTGNDRSAFCTGKVNEINIDLSFCSNLFSAVIDKEVSIYRTIKFNFNTFSLNGGCCVGCTGDREVDFDGDGLYEPLQSEMTHTFPAGAILQTITFKVRIKVFNTWAYQNITVKIVKDAETSYPAPDEIWDITGNNFTPSVSCGASNFAPEDLEAIQATGRAYIKFSNGNTDRKLKRPLIFVEGLDFGVSHLCSSNEGEGILRNGSFGWDNFVAGKWEDDGAQPIEKMATLYQEFLKEYDVILLDFTDGAGWIQANGEVLIKLIQRINASKVGCNSNIIVGASMGGQVSRWALTKMEQRKLSHDSGLYCSFDSPQKGANISLGLQSTIYFLSKYGLSPSDEMKNQWAKLNRPAPQQLIKFHFNATLGGNGCVRSDYESEINGLGYPKQSTNIGVVLGAGNKANQGYGNNDVIFRALLVDTDIGLTALDAFIAASGGYHRGDNIDIIASVKIPSNLNQAGIPTRFHHFYLNKVADNAFKFDVYRYQSLYPDQTSVTMESSSFAYTSSFQNWDMAPGCYRDDFLSVEKTVKSLSSKIQIPTNKFNFTFMPTVSALDINTTDLFYKVNDILVTKETDPTVTPFKYVYYEAASNKAHVEITTDLIDWMKARLSPQEAPSSPLNTRFNYANIGQGQIAGLQIITGGTYVVNGNGGAARGALANSEKEIIERWVVGCENGIQIKDGGKFVFGEGEIRNGIVHVGAGASVTLDGGLLNLNNEKSALIIEDGGKLILNYGTINLSHPEAKILIKKGGQLIFNGTFSFTGPGYFDFEKDHVLVLNAPFDLTGIGKTNRFIQLEDNAKLKIASKKIKLRSGAVVYKEGSSIQIGQAGRGDFGDNTFTGSGFNAMAIDANASNVLLVDHSDFGGLKVGIQVQNLANIVDLNKVTYCNFHTNTTGIKLANNLTSGMRVSYSTFAGDKAIDALNTNIITARECQILASAFTFDETGVLLDNVKYYEMIGGMVSRYVTGINATHYANISMKSKARIEYCGTGINMNGTVRDDQPSVGYLRMNCSELVDNFTGVNGTDVVLYIDNGVLASGNGANVYKTMSDENSKIFEICYYQRDIRSINARGNYWNTHNSNPGQAPSPFAYSIKNRACSENVNLVTAPLVAQYPTLLSCSSTVVGNPGDPMLGTPYDRFSVTNCTECLLNRNGQQYALHTQFGAAIESFDNEQYETAESQMLPLAEITTAERDLMTTNCKLYVDVARCMTYASSTGGAARLSGGTWVESALASKQAVVENSAMTIIPNPASGVFVVSLLTTQQGYDLDVIDVLGRLVYTERDNMGQFTIAAVNWSSGLYSVVVKDHSTGKVMTSKVVIDK